MSVLLPNEYKQCEKIWEKVYTEYRRIGYRLKNEILLKLELENMSKKGGYKC